ALRTPVRCASSPTFLAIFDWGPAPPTRLTAAFVNQKSRTFSGAALEHRFRLSHDPSQSVIRQRIDALKRIHSGGMQPLRLVDVPDSGEHALIEQRICDLGRSSLAQSADRLIDVERFGEKVGTLPR